MFHVYKITNLINHKSYFGITKQNPNYRFKQHGKPNNSILNSAIKKYGIENFIIEILYTNLTQIEAKQKEIELIKENNTVSPNGYNCTEGGEGRFGYVYSEIEKEKLSKTMKERGHKPNKRAIQATTEKCQKQWIVTSPSNQIFHITNLRKFCRENNLSPENLWKVSKGIINQSQGWKCKLLL